MSSSSEDLSSLDLSALKSIRTKARRVVSTTKHLLKTLRDREPSKLKLDVLQRHKQNLHEADKDYQNAQQEIICSHQADIDVTKEEKAFDDHVIEIMEIEECADHLVHIREAHVAIHSVTALIQGVERLLLTDPEHLDTTELDKVAEQLDNLLRVSIGSSDESLKGIYDDFQSRYLKVKAEIIGRITAMKHKLSKEMEIRSHSSTRSSSPVRHSTAKKVKIPKLEIPKFDGNSLNWATFWERFSSTIHSNEELTDEEKLSYLRDAMKDETAKRIVSPATGTVHSYASLLKLLKEYYEDKREIHENHLQALVNITNVKATHSDVVELMLLWEKHLTGLQSTGQYEVKYIMSSLAVSSLGPKLRAKWSEFTKSYKDVPEIDVFKEFLKEQTKLLKGTTTDGTHNTSSKPQHHQRDKRPGKAVLHVANSQTQCAFCSGSFHPPYMCSSFRDMPVEKRQEMIQTHRFCINCLKLGHKVKDCRSSHRCKQCNKKHNTLLHQENDKTHSTSSNGASSPTVASQTAAISSPPATINSNMLNHVNVPQQELPSALLMTAQVIIRTADGKEHTARALLDPGSSASLVSSRVVSHLGLKKINRTTHISGVQGCHSRPSHHIVTFSIAHQGGLDLISVTAAVVERVSIDLPLHAVLEAKSWDVTRNLKLADSSFHQPGKVDILLGMDVWGEILLSGIHTGKSGEPKAYNTIFGWAIAGTYSSPPTRPDSQISLHVVCSPEEDLNQLLKSFWEIDNLKLEPHSTLTKDEKHAVAVFQESQQLTDEGRYKVKLPRRLDGSPLGDSRKQAVLRFQSMESSLHRKGTWESFSNAVRDYIDKGHAEAVCSEDGNTGNIFYLPMHAVIKPSSSTTKIRIVFDGSSKSSSGNSLNDILLPGPNVYPPLADQIVKFRQHPFGLSADISQMFRQIELYQEDRDLHRFVWRESPNQPLKDWRMTRLTFGITSSPFIATEALRQVARDFEEEFPTAAKIVLNDFYVDDLLTGTETLQQAIQLREQLNQLLDRGGFLLRKWRSNSEDLLASISPDLKETDIVQTLPSPKDCPKTLGVHWDTASDAFYVSTPPLCSTDPLTKRKLTSEIAKVYDILGWYSPAVLLVKTLLQQLWENKTDWDDIVSDGIKQVWEQWQTQLPQLTQHPIARCYFHFDKEKLSLQIHGFSDASEKGYAAVVYLRTMYTDLSVSVALVASKTRVAPLKRETIPRLELCGALLLAKLLANVKESLNLSLSQLYAWTDSTIVLDWLDGSPRRLKTFVGNRVAQIMDLLPPTAWRHVPSETNPADCASRGMMPGELVRHDLWWTGPEWLYIDPSQWPAFPRNISHNIPEVRQSVNVINTERQWLVDQYSSYDKIRRILSWIRRFISNCRNRNERNLSSSISAAEMRQVQTSLLQKSQQLFFSDELRALNKEACVADSSPLKMLRPFLDSEGVLRVGGRLSKSCLTYSQKHPAILHHKDRLSRLILKKLHLEGLHSGPQQMLSTAGSEFHIIACKRLARSVF